jgi:hypothetical protein
MMDGSARWGCGLSSVTAAGVMLAILHTTTAIAPTEPLYDAINVWPMPTNITLCKASGLGKCLGPHAVITPTITVTVAPSCGGMDGATQAMLTALVTEAVTLGTSFKPSPRTYNEPPYAAPDAFCLSRCSLDADCGKGGHCYVPSERRWNSTTACSPSTQYAAGCGCCVLTPTLPSIPKLTVTCGTKTSTTSTSDVDIEGSYTLDATSGGITVLASTANGAANGIATLAQLLRFDTSLRVHVLDFLPVAIDDTPRYSWRGYMLDTSRHFIPTAEILQLIDGMYAAKLNILHW